MEAEAATVGATPRLCARALRASSADGPSARPSRSVWSPRVTATSSNPGRRGLRPDWRVRIVASPASVGRHPQPLHLVDPRISDVLRAPVAPDPKATRDILRKAAEHLAHALAERLERGPAITNLRRVPAHELVHALVDGAEEPAPAILFGVEPRRVGTPHLIRVRRGDRAGVRRVAIRWAEAPGREQVGTRYQVRLGKGITRTVAREIAQVKRGEILKGEVGLGRKRADLGFDDAKDEFLT